MIPAGYRRALREHDLRKAMDLDIEQVDDGQDLTLMQILAIGGTVFATVVLGIMALVAKYGETVAQWLSWQ